MRKILIFLFVFSAAIGYGQNAKITPVSNPELSISIVTTTGAMRTLTTGVTGKFYYTTDVGKEGFWKYDPNDVTSAEDTGTCMVVGSLRFKRLFDQYHVNGSWFGMIGDGVTDNTKEAQLWINASKYRYAYLPAKGGKYRMNKVYGSLTPITIDLGWNTIAPYLPTLPTDNVIFYFAPNFTKNSDSTFTVSSAPGSRLKWKNLSDVKIMNGYVDLEYTLSGFWGTGLTNFSKIIRPVIQNITINNGSGSAIVNPNASATTLNDSASIIQDMLMDHVNFKNNGLMIGVIADNNYATGSTSIGLYSRDKEISLLKKLQVGFVFQFATNATGSDLEAAGSYVHCNAPFRIKTITIDPLDSLHATITIASLTYTASAGFTEEAVNTGLKAPIIKNAWCIPISGTEFTTWGRFPTLSASSGSNVFTMTDTVTASQRGWRQNIYVGEKFQFANGGPAGVFTVASFTANTITADINAGSTTAGTTVIMNGVLGNSISIAGDIRGFKASWCTFSGGLHAVYATTNRGVGQWWDDIQSSLEFDHCTEEYNWMNNEIFYTNSVLIPVPMQGFSVTAGDSVITMVTPSNYKVVTTTDISGRGTNDTAFTAVGTGTVTALNSLVRGDVFNIGGVKGHYIITNIQTVSPFAITVHRYNAKTHLDQPGGFLNSVTSANINATTNAVFRNFSVYAGCNEIFGSVTYTNTDMKWNLRNVTGYAGVSGSANRFNALNVNVFTAERPAFELTGNVLNLDGVKIYEKLWQGQSDIPGVTNSIGHSSGSIAVFGGPSNVYINNLKVFWSGIDSPLFNAITQSSIAMNGTTITSPYDEDIFSITNSNIDGISGRLMNAAANKTIGGLPYATQYFNKEILQGSFTWTKTCAGPHLFGHVYSGNLIFGPAQIDFRNTGLSTIHYFESDNPNPEMFPNPPFGFASGVLETPVVPAMSFGPSYNWKVNFGHFGNSIDSLATGGVYISPNTTINFGTGTADVTHPNLRPTTTSSSNTTMSLSSGDYVLSILVNPTSALSSFSVGSTSGGTDIIPSQPLASGLNNFSVNYYSSAGGTLYFTGITSSTVITLIKQQ